MGSVFVCVAIYRMDIWLFFWKVTKYLWGLPVNLGWPVSPRDPPVYTFPVLDHKHMPPWLAFYVGAV